MIGCAPNRERHRSRERGARPPSHQADGGHGRGRHPGDGGHHHPRLLHRQRPPRLQGRPLPHHRPASVRGARALHRLPGRPQGQARAAARLLDGLLAPREVPGGDGQGGALRHRPDPVPAAALAAAREAHPAGDAAGGDGVHRALHPARRHRVEDRPPRARLRGLGQRPQLRDPEVRASSTIRSCGTRSSTRTAPGTT